MKLLKTCLCLVFIYLCTVSAGVEAVQTGGKGKKLLCWTNSDGVKECGDKLPPEYAQEGHEELNKSGRVVKETDRAKTAEELEEEKKQAVIKAAADKAAKDQAAKDKILLDTFSSVEDIELARDSKLATLESSISVAEKRGVKLHGSLDSRVNQAAAAEREGKTPPQNLLKDIESLKRQIKENDDFIANSRKEKEAVAATYNNDIVRYKELTAKK